MQRLQAAMHTVTGATSIAGLKKWAAQQPAPGADGAASAQYVAVASDACNIEFDFLGRPQAHTCRAGVAVPAAAAPGTCMRENARPSHQEWPQGPSDCVERRPFAPLGWPIHLLASPIQYG